jgi:hypothetical protein
MPGLICRGADMLKAITLEVEVPTCFCPYTQLEKAGPSLDIIDFHPHTGVRKNTCTKICFILRLFSYRSKEL